MTIFNSSCSLFGSCDFILPYVAFFSRATACSGRSGQKRFSWQTNAHFPEVLFSVKFLDFNLSNRTSFSQECQRTPNFFYTFHKFQLLVLHDRWLEPLVRGLNLGNWSNTREKQGWFCSLWKSWESEKKQMLIALILFFMIKFLVLHNYSFYFPTNFTNKGTTNSVMFLGVPLWKIVDFFRLWSLDSLERSEIILTWTYIGFDICVSA